MANTGGWSGKVVTRARAHIARQLPAPCGRCGKPVHPGDPWVVGHTVARSLRPDLSLDPSNWRPEHKACSDASGQEAVIEKARAEGARLAQGADSFPGDTQPQEAPPLPFSLPSPGQPAPLVVPEAMTWASLVQSAPEWLQPWLVGGVDFNPPLVVSPLHPAAVGTYAAADPDRAVCPEGAVAWIERVEGKRLRHWQKLAIALQLQHDAEGRLLKRTVTETAPRRSGKSVRLRGVALWRMEFGHAIFGERQEIVHTGSDLAVCRKAQKEAWRWAEAHWGSKSVTRGNGKEAIERPDDGSVWLVRAQDATYGWDTTLGLVDEGWDVKPDTVSEGLEPSLMGRQSPQLHQTSTSHRRARSTMRTALTTALTENDPQTLLLWWGAPPGADISDPSVWKAASPYWDAERAEYVARMYAKALAGEEDPEFDDPDPMRGFACQYANRWDLKERRAPKGSPVVEAEAWAELVQVIPEVTPAAVAVEAWFADGVTVAKAYRVEGRVVVAAEDFPTVTAAAASLSAVGRTVLVGSSLLDNPAWQAHAVRTQPAKGTTAQAAGDLGRLIAEDVLRHDGGEHLTTQVLELRTVPSADGARLASNGRADAVKAAAWAAGAARQPSKGRPRIILADGVVTRRGMFLPGPQGNPVA